MNDEIDGPFCASAAYELGPTFRITGMADVTVCENVVGKEGEFCSDCLAAREQKRVEEEAEEKRRKRDSSVLPWMGF